MEKLLATIKDGDARRTADFLISGGMRPLHMKDFDLRLAALGYHIDRHPPFFRVSWARWLTGPLAGVSNPQINAFVIEKITGLHWPNIAAGRGPNFAALKSFRDSAFGISRGRLVTF